MICTISVTLVVLHSVVVTWLEGKRGRKASLSTAFSLEKRKLQFNKGLEAAHIYFGSHSQDVQQVYSDKFGF